MRKKYGLCKILQHDLTIRFGTDLCILRSDHALCGSGEFSQHWYVGDGLFSDGMHFALDNYNSYVIQPFLTDILDAIEEKDKSFSWFAEDMDNIAARYSEIHERSINTDGSFPVYGGSIVYRGGAFHHLANMSLKKKLPGRCL